MVSAGAGACVFGGLWKNVGSGRSDPELTKTRVDDPQNRREESCRGCEPFAVASYGHLVTRMVTGSALTRVRTRSHLACTRNQLGMRTSASVAAAAGSSPTPDSSAFVSLSTNAAFSPVVSRPFFSSSLRRTATVIFDGSVIATSSVVLPARRRVGEDWITLIFLGAETVLVPLLTS